MAKRYLVGVDVGTLGTKAIVVSLEGEILGSALAEYGVEHPRPSWAEQWPQVWEDAVYNAIRRSIEKAGIAPSDVAGACISGLYGGSGIPVDKGLNPLRPCLIWMDRRAAEQVKWIKEDTDLDRVFEITGNYVDTYFGYPKILWIKEKEPQVWARTHTTCWGVIHRGEAYSKSLVSMPHVVNSTEEIYTWGGAATSGGLVRWFRDRFGEPEVEEAEKTGEDTYQLLDARASEIPAGSDGLLVLPYFMGERAPLWDPDARGTILGLTLYHTKPHLFRALMEAAAYSLRHSIEVGKAIGLHLKEETRIVGGVTKSNLWTKILADVTGRKMLIPAGGTGAPLGDALLAGIGVGLIADYRVIEQWTRIDRVDTPNPATKAVYDKYYALYRAFYEDIKDRIHELSAIGGGKE